MLTNITKCDMGASERYFPVNAFSKEVLVPNSILKTNIEPHLIRTVCELLKKWNGHICHIGMVYDLFQSES